MTGLPILDRSGTLEILLELSEEDARFTDIQESTDLSPTTLSDRLKQGKNEELWEERLEEVSGSSSRRVYSLLPRGRKVAEEAEERDLPDLIAERDEVMAEYEKQINEIQKQEHSPA